MKKKFCTVYCDVERDITIVKINWNDFNETEVADILEDLRSFVDRLQPTVIAAHYSDEALEKRKQA